MCAPGECQVVQPKAKFFTITYKFPPIFLVLQIHSSTNSIFFLCSFTCCFLNKSSTYIHLIFENSVSSSYVKFLMSSDHSYLQSLVQTATSSEPPRQNESLPSLASHSLELFLLALRTSALYQSYASYSTGVKPFPNRNGIIFIFYMWCQPFNVKGI